MTLIYAYQGRNKTVEITVQDENGDDIELAALDKIRAIIGHEGQTAKLTVESGTNTANGSSFTKHATVYRLRLDAQDLTFDHGTYTLFIDILDTADADDWKNVQRQVFCLEQT
jgi:hypothetical protein